MKFLLVFLLFSLPAGAVTTTKYLRGCGGVSEDLQKDMPPVDNQLQSPWCASFSAKALLEYHRHVNRPGDTYQNRVSVMDVNSWNSVNPDSSRGKLPNIADGGSVYHILEGVQVSGQLYSEADFPFDQALFDWDRGTLARLTRYYEAKKTFSFGSLCADCGEKGSENRTLEKQFPSISEFVAGAKDSGSFLSAMAKKYPVIAGPRAGAKREPVEAFNIQSSEFSNGDAFLDEVAKNLREKRPMAASVCANQLLRLPGLGQGMVAPPSSASECGEHALIVMGMKLIDGQCQLNVRSSWGTQWPQPKGGGSAWIPVKDFLRVSASKPGKGEIVLFSVTKRAPDAAVENTQIFSDGGSYSGPTKKGQPDGQGKARDASGTIIQGEFKNGQLNGKGKIIRPNGGGFSEGTFVQGSFVSGNHEGTMSDGSTYKGAFSNNRPNGKGRLVLPNGTVMEGIFKDGALAEGNFRGLIDPAANLYYDGPLVNGSTTPAGKFQKGKAF